MLVFAAHQLLQIPTVSEECHGW